MDNNILSVIVLAVVVAFVIFATIYIFIKLKRGTSSLTSIALGATDEFLNTDKSKAAEVIVNENAGKRFNVKNQSGDKPFK